MNSLCNFLIEYYKDNGIADKPSMKAFKCSIKNEKKEAVDYIIKELKIGLKTCLSDIEVINTSTTASVFFDYKSNDCEICKDGNYLFLKYY